jgi:uncharacterized membrane protein (UPF0127 family)
MPIKNLTTNRFLAKQFRTATSGFEKAIGLMFSKPNEALVMVFDKEQRVLLHMLFVPATIDVLFLNKNFEVVDVKQGFRPFTLYSSKKKSKYVIELPAGAIKESKTKLGDKISMLSADGDRKRQSIKEDKDKVKNLNSDHISLSIVGT